MMIGKFEKIEVVNCQVEHFMIYLIISENIILHLTFSKTRHMEAIKWLKDDGIQPISTERREKEHKVCSLLQKHFSGEIKSLQMKSHSPFIESGTPFQKKVWDLIQKIPYGETRTYGDLANLMGNIRLSRAVGQACNKNPLALIIPCHRVVGAKGLVGFAGGITIKEKLLSIEQKRCTR